MQGLGLADDLLYFKCPTTKQMWCPVNAYDPLLPRNTTVDRMSFGHGIFPKEEKIP
jgi:hypothetical protein